MRLVSAFQLEKNGAFIFLAVSTTSTLFHE